MQKIVLFIAPRHVKWSTPSKIGNLFLNRFAIDENEGAEIVKIFELEHKFPHNADSIQDCIDNGVKTMVDFGNDDLIPHFIYSSAVFSPVTKLEEKFVTSMIKFGSNHQYLQIFIWKEYVL